MTQENETKASSMSAENRKSLRLFRLLSVLAMIAAAATATGFGLVLRPFLAWEADRVGAERRAKEHLSELEETGKKREADLARVFDQKSKAMEESVAASLKRLEDVEQAVRTANARKELAERMATKVEEELASKRAEIATFEPSLVEGRQSLSDLQRELTSLQTAVGALAAESNRLAVLIATARANLTDVTERTDAKQHDYDDWERRVSVKKEELKRTEEYLFSKSKKAEDASSRLATAETSLSAIEGKLRDRQIQFEDQTNFLSRVQHEVQEMTKLRTTLNQIVGRYSVWTNNEEKARVAADREDLRLAELEGKRNAIQKDIRDLTVARSERDEAFRLRDAAIRERDAAIRERDEAIRECNAFRNAGLNKEDGENFEKVFSAEVPASNDQIDSHSEEEVQ